MKNLKLLLLAIVIIVSSSLTAQMAVTTDGSSADASAMLEVKSTDKGFLPPRMTTAEIVNIASPANGLFVFNTTDNKAYIFVSADNQWKEVYYGTGIIDPDPCEGFSSFVNAFDNKSYNIVSIGTQCWMAENLNSNRGFSYWYGGLETNGDIYGRLYHLTTALTVCPSGWHLPTDAEWKTMEMELGMSQTEADAVDWRGTHNEGEKMKEIGTSHWNSLNNATNESGFTGLPGGRRLSTGVYDRLNSHGYWWSSTEGASSSYAWFRLVRNDIRYVWRETYVTGTYLSVRCVKD